MIFFPFLSVFLVYLLVLVQFNLTVLMSSNFCYWKSKKFNPNKI